MSVKRQFPTTQSSTFADLTSLTREELVERYKAFIGPLHDEEVRQARAFIVRKFRSGNGVYPDTELYRWYKAEDWLDDGSYVGKEPLPYDAAAAKARDGLADDKAKRLAVAKDALAGVEAKLGVKPYQLPPAESADPVLDKPLDCEGQAKFDKAAYQRDYMKRRRDAAKANKPDDAI